MVQLADHRLPGPERVPGHARRGAQRGRDAGRGEGDRLPGGAVRGHGEGVRLHPRHQRGARRARHRAAAEGQSTTTPETREERGSRSRRRSSAPTRRRSSTRRARGTNSTSRSFLSANCFGDHYTRTGIDIKTRELLTFSMLVAMGGCEPQVRGHVAVNLHVATTARCSSRVVTQLLPFIGYPRA